MTEINPASVPVGEDAKNKTVTLDCLDWQPINKTFVIKALSRLDHILIGNVALVATGNVGISRLDMNAAAHIMAGSTAQVGVVKGPPWWDCVDNCKIDEVIFELERKINEWSSDFQSLLKKKEPV